MLLSLSTPVQFCISLEETETTLLLLFLLLCIPLHFEQAAAHMQTLMWVMLYGAVAGSVDAGKSSLVGVLTHGIDGRPLLDNGCGSARMNVFQHKHEIETGRTSSLSQQMLGYDEEGEPISCLARPLCLCACVCVCVCVRTSVRAHVCAHIHV